MNKDELNGKFYLAYHQPTSGSMGSTLLKFLHEELPEMDGNKHFVWLEGTASQLQQLGSRDAFPMLYE